MHIMAIGIVILVMTVLISGWPDRKKNEADQKSVNEEKKLGEVKQSPFKFIKISFPRPFAWVMGFIFILALIIFGSLGPIGIGGFIVIWIAFVLLSSD